MHGCFAVFTRRSGADFAAECLAHKLHSVANAKHGHAEIEQLVGAGPWAFKICTCLLYTSKIGGVYVKDQLAVEKGILFQPTGGDDPVLFQLLKQLRISDGRFLEMDIDVRSLRDNILDVYKRQLLPLNPLTRRIKGDHATVIKLLSKEPLWVRKDPKTLYGLRPS